MAKGQKYQIERIQCTDARSGVRFLQLTSFPVISWPLPYFYANLTNGFTSDSRTIVFCSLRSCQRDASFDLFRVDVDGDNLIQLTDRSHLGAIVLAGNRRVVYFFDAGALWSVHLDTFAEVEVARADVGLQQWSWGYLSPDERWYFAKAVNKSGEPALIRIATDGSGSKVIHTGDDWNVHSVDPRGEALFVLAPELDGRGLVLVDYDGAIVGHYGKSDRFAHSSPLGVSGIFQGCSTMPDRAIITLGPNQGEPRALVEGPYFWHSSATLDGQWIVADTNWPNDGLQLVCVKTRRFGELFHPGNSAGHPQTTHAHPQFSPDGRYVLFNSDRTGIAQMYLAEIPREFRNSLLQ
ncbi:MAG: PD40 domain-containing protein [Candidatus Hydrogenedentes bacterium]|nr:PD40 domain-containing protein [Candidatus Hydrogenedentota bacterium]